MAGELWRSYFQIGLETTAGTTVPATRRMYFDVDGSSFKRERDARPHKFATGSRDNVRAFTLGPTKVSGTLKMPLSATEIVELLLMGLRSGVTPSGSGVYLWSFTPGTTLAPATIEWHDGARAWEAGGCYVNKLKFSGGANEENSVEAEIFALNLATASMTGSLTERVPDFIEGWETLLYIDALGGTAGTTNIAGTLINWEIEFDNQLGRKYFADNTLSQGGTPIGELMVTAKLTFEAAASQAATEFTNWDAVTERLVRLSFGNNVIISGSDEYFVTIDLPGAWDAFDLGGSDEGTRTYELSLQYVYDPTNAFGLRVRCQNNRSSAW